MAARLEAETQVEQVARDIYLARLDLVAQAQPPMLAAQVMAAVVVEVAAQRQQLEARAAQGYPVAVAVAVIMAARE